jgi:diguanylate cyclase (GGDEF)-like protein
MHVPGPSSRFIRSSKIRLRRGPGAAALAVVALLSLGAHAQELPQYGLPRAEKPVTLVREVRALPLERARQDVPVRLTGVVTVLSGWKNSFFLQDGTAGISVDRLDQVPELQAGDRVVVRGTSAPGSFAPIVLSQSVEVIGKAKMPVAKFYKPVDLLGGNEDSQWIAVRGNVRSAEVKQTWGRPALTLHLDIGSNTIMEVRVREFDPEAAQALIGATVAVRGVCGTIFNDRRQFVGLRLFMDSLDDLTIEKAPPIDPFDVPARPLGALFQFSDTLKIADLVKVTGVVTWARLKEGFYLQDGTKAAFVERADTTGIRVGTKVEVVGYPASRMGVPTLHASFVRQVSGPQSLHPAVHSAAEIITVRDGFISTPYDDQLVTLQGKLLKQVSGTSANTLLIQDGNKVFRALMPTDELVNVEEGSLLRVTGICSPVLDETGQAFAFFLLLRNDTDIVVVRRAPWWNTTRALQLSAALGVTLIGIAVWAVVSRRRDALKALVVTDPLTSLYNRRGFELLAHKQREIALRRRSDMLLFYLDINRFKQINDTYGHRQGDRALQHVASALHETFRESDIIARLGGDEFAVMAIDANPTSKEMLLHRLHEEIEKINSAGTQPFRLSISTGVVVCRRDEQSRTLEDLLESADALMYAQKRERREQRDQSRSMSVRKPAFAESRTMKASAKQHP